MRMVGAGTLPSGLTAHSSAPRDTGEADDLLLGDTQVHDQRAGIQAHVPLVDQFLRFLLGIAVTDEPSPPGLAAQEDIGGNAQAGHEIEFLIDDADA